MKFTLTGPDGKRYTVHADNEAAAQAAIDSLYPERAGRADNNAAIVELLQRLVYPSAPRPRRDYGPDLLAALERIEAKEPPMQPLPEPVDLSPVVDALVRLERKEAKETDLGPVSASIADLASRVDRLLKQQAKAEREEADRQAELLKAIGTLSAAVAAPRKLIRDNSNRVIGAEIDLEAN